MAKTAAETGSVKDRLRDYFNGVGFERWSAIYGEGQLSSIRQSVREGHSLMLNTVQNWLDEHDLPLNAQILDAGCGTGLFCTAMAELGYPITAVDIAPQMVQAAMQQSREAGIREYIEFVVADLETISGKYDAVVCLDVLIHYPRALFAQLASHLASLTRGPFIFTYAPHNPALALMHRIGGFFPKNQRRTNIQMIPERQVHAVLEQAGMRVQRSERISRGFYHVALIEATPAP